MAYTYGDYESQSTDALRLARLRLHIAEVTQKISAATSGDGMSRDPSSLVTYMEQLQTRRRELESVTGNYGGISQIKFGTPN